MSSTDPPDDLGAPPSAFGRFALDPRLQQTVTGLGFETPTPIQDGAIGVLLEGRDMVGRARTGSGKTAAFGLPLLQQSLDTPSRGVQTLVLAPTRELALQVTEALRSYAAGLPIRLLTVYGGAPYGPQVQGLRRGVEVVVGTPGRLIDLESRRLLDLSTIRLVVIDEADELLRMGFIDDVEKLLSATPTTRQVALFSATMPAPIRKVAETYLKDAVEVQVEQTVFTVDHIEQRWSWVPHYHKLEALQRVLRAAPKSTALVFARTRATCAETAAAMSQRGFDVEALHGDLSQTAREAVMRRFRSRRINVVVATDVAARGLDVEHITHVINYDLPDDIASYVHRIGRTGRAGRKGIALSFVTPREIRRIPMMDRLLKVRIVETEIPSDAVIAAQQRTSFEAELRAALEEPAANAAREGLTKLLENDDWSTEDVAAAALSLLARQRGVSFEPSTDDRPPRWSRPRRQANARTQRPQRGRDNDRRQGDRGPRPRATERTPADFEAANEVELFLAAGTESGIRPADIVGLLANEMGVPSRRIGRITLLDRKCFVGLPREIAEGLVAKSNPLSLRGMTVPIALARPREQRDDAAPARKPGKPGKFNKAGKPGTPGKPKPGKPGKFSKPGKFAKRPKPGKPGKPGKPKPGNQAHKPLWAKAGGKPLRGRHKSPRGPRG